MGNRSIAAFFLGFSLIGAAVMLSGCAADPAAGYAAKTPFRTDVSSVAVPIFDNSTFDRDVAAELTSAVMSALEVRTPYRIAPRSRADTLLRGTVRSIRLDQLSRSRATGLGEEVAIVISIDFEWSRLDSGEVLVERRSFEADGLFVPSAPLGEPIEIGRFEAVQKLAADLVDTMRAPW